MPGWLERYLQRHQHPVSLGLHIIGVPMIAAAPVLAGTQLYLDRWDLWWRPLMLLIVGYLLQWIGHCVEGNDMGEVVLIKRWLGRPYTAISPRYAASSTSDPSPTQPPPCRDGPAHLARTDQHLKQ